MSMQKDYVFSFYDNSLLHWISLGARRQTKQRKRDRLEPRNRYMHRSRLFLDLCCGRGRYCTRLEFTFVYVYWVRYSQQLIARRKCGAINCVKKKNRNEFCLPNECHTRSALALESYVFVFTIFS